MLNAKIRSGEMILVVIDFSDGLDNETIVVHFNNAKQVFRKQRRDVLTNVIYLAGSWARSNPINCSNHNFNNNSRFVWLQLTLAVFTV